MLRQFIVDNQQADVTQLALQRKRYPMLSDSDFRFCLQQIDGRQRTKDKLPSFAQMEGWQYPPRLNLEQCSSERTARFKAQVLGDIRKQQSEILLIDGTGGYGVDTFFMSEQAQETHYFEQNSELAVIAEQNFRLAGKEIHCHAEPFDVTQLSQLMANSQRPMVLYMDPARRDNHGGKVFLLEDCTPNVIDIIREIRTEQSIRVLLKLSPMLDFHQAVAQLGGSWDIYVVSVNNEVKELLLLSEGTGKVYAVMLADEGEQVFSFTQDEESGAEVQYISFVSDSSVESALNGLYVYEPDAALLKAGCFRLLSARYGLLKADRNTHLYLNSRKSKVESQKQKVESQKQNLPGRWWQIVGVYTRVKDVQRVCTRTNVLTRNYVLAADALRKQLRLKDGGDDYIIGCRIADKPLLLHCQRI